MTQLLTFTHSCDEAVAQVTQALARAGLRVSRSFDLRVARAAHTDCTCPHHGADQCNCQMIMLLVYGAAERPATLVCHGRDDHSELILVDSPDQRAAPELEAAIVAALKAEALTHLKHEQVVPTV